MLSNEKEEIEQCSKNIYNKFLFYYVWTVKQVLLIFAVNCTIFPGRAKSDFCWLPTVFSWYDSKNVCKWSKLRVNVTDSDQIYEPSIWDLILYYTVLFWCITSDGKKMNFIHTPCPLHIDQLNKINLLFRRHHYTFLHIVDDMNVIEIRQCSILQIWFWGFLFGRWTDISPIRRISLHGFSFDFCSQLTFWIICPHAPFRLERWILSTQDFLICVLLTDLIS